MNSGQRTAYLGWIRIQTLRRLKQECCEHNASLSYIVRPCEEVEGREETKQAFCYDSYVRKRA
jgi:hypothetical protein